MPKSPIGDNVEALRNRWQLPKRQRLLDKFFGQRSFIDFAGTPEDGLADPTLIKDLRAAPLAGRELQDLLLVNADVRWADFTGSRVQGPFQHANLAHADFSRAVLSACPFWKSRLIDCRFEHTALLRVSFEQCILFGASFRDAQLADVRFESADLQNTDFTGARLENCVLSRVKLDNSQRAFWAAQAQCRLEEVEWCEEALGEPA
ncbi:MAG TPA: pentapeptide repeat-containing protein [Burkholderiales bacterium]|nr:pentapeptide repeat-containing protein [Burkholderiales bacterium]